MEVVDEDREPDKQTPPRAYRVWCDSTSFSVSATSSSICPRSLAPVSQFNLPTHHEPPSPPTASALVPMRFAFACDTSSILSHVSFNTVALSVRARPRQPSGTYVDAVSLV